MHQGARRSKNLQHESRRELTLSKALPRKISPDGTVQDILCTFTVSLHRIGAELELLGPLNRLHPLSLAHRTFKVQDNLFGRLRILVENGFRLTTKAGLLLVITALSLCTERCLPRLVLCHLVGRMGPAPAAVGVTAFRDVHHG